MINQTAISARIDNATLWKIEQESMVSGMKRNRILNEGARMFLDILDRRREMRIHGDSEVRKKILSGILSTWIPEASEFKIV